MARFQKVSLDEFKKRTWLPQDKVEQCYEEIKLPTRSTIGSAGYDFYLPADIHIDAGESLLVPTGISVELDLRLVLLCFPRSGLGIKYGVRLKNTVGIIDADYYNNPENEGHIMACLENAGTEDVNLKAGDRFMQGIIMPYVITDNDVTLDKRTGGMGSTGR